MDSLKVFYLNITFYALFVSFSLSAITLFGLLLLILVPFLSRRRIIKILRLGIRYYGYTVVKFLSFPLIKVYYRDFAETKESGPYIFISNHKSLSDPFLMTNLPYECVPVVNIWPFRIPVFGWFMRWAEYLSVNEMSSEEFSRKAISLLDKGVSIIAFPEGTRAGFKSLGKFNSLIFRVALQSHYPIVPVCICGNENIPAKGTVLLRPGTIKMYKLPALEWEDYKNWTAFKLKQRVRNTIANKLLIEK